MYEPGGVSRVVTYETRVANELASQPQEGLLEVVVGLGRDVVVLQVLLAVEGDGLGLDLSLLDVDLVAAEDNWDVLANTDEVTYSAHQPVASSFGSGGDTYGASWERSCR